MHRVPDINRKYRSPSQPTDIFDQFADNLELTLDQVANHNPFL